MRRGGSTNEVRRVKKIHKRLARGLDNTSMASPLVFANWPVSFLVCSRRMAFRPSRKKKSFGFAGDSTLLKDRRIYV